MEQRFFKYSSIILHKVDEQWMEDAVTYTSNIYACYVKNVLYLIEITRNPTVWRFEIINDCLNYQIADL